MKKLESRRHFLKAVLFSSGCFGLKGGDIGSESKKGDCEIELERLFLYLQKREMQEKAALFRKLKNQYGDAVLRMVSHQVMEETEIKLRETKGCNRGIEGVMENLWNHTHATHLFAVEKRSENFLKLRVTRCLYAEEMRRMNAADIGLAFYCSYDYGFCRGLNPRITFIRTRTLMEGADCCDHAYELKAN
jgi:hypothetical protein